MEEKGLVVISAISFPYNRPVPFFLLSGQEKAKMLPSIFSKNLVRWRIDQGWISPFWLHFVLLYGMAAILWVAIVKMILQNLRMEGERISKTNKPLFGMIVMLAASYFIISFPGLFGALFDVGWFNVYFMAFSLSITLMEVAIFLALSPQVLYGFVYHPAYLITEAQTQESQVPDIDLVRIAYFIDLYQHTDNQQLTLEAPAKKNRLYKQGNFY